MVRLAHHTPDCTGRWGAELHAHQIVWVCSHCGAAGRDTEENHVTVIRENTLSLRLQQLTGDGRKLLDRERRT